MNHYGNFPTHCPQWAKMDLAEKKRTSKLAEYCLKCFAPNVFIKNTLDCNRHHKTKCYVSGTNKHKFSCLNTSCLKHSWICQNHVDENRPLLAAHYKEFDTMGQQIPTPAPASHTLNQHRTAYPPAVSLDLTQPTRAAPPLIVSSTAQKTRIIDINSLHVRPRPLETFRTTTHQIHVPRHKRPGTSCSPQPRRNQRPG